MNRVFLLILAIASISTSVFSTEKAKKPNFVVIFIDDMGYSDIGPFGTKINRTPQLDRLCKEGMKLTSFYVSPVCSPSRAQIMTGCYAKRVGLDSVVYAVQPHGLNPEEHTIAELLKDQGYATMCVGKWHLGDQPEFLPTNHGFDHHFGLPYSNDMKKVPLPLLIDGKVIEAPVEQEPLTARFTEAAVKFIKAKKDEPFFLYLAHMAVHGPIKPGKAFAGRSKHGIYSDWVEEVDWSVGRVLDTLRELKLDSNTMVLFTSDNGPWLNLTRKGKGGLAEPLKGGKFTTWEGGVRVPTIAWWPGKIKAGSESDGIVSVMDLLPTFVGLAGGKVPDDKKIDGIDVWPLLSGKTTKSPRKKIFHFNGPNLEAVRVGKWKLRKPRRWKPELDAKETWKLYDLEADIGETKDVSAANPRVMKRLQGLIAEMDKDLGVRRIGPGVRKPGHVENPKGLLLGIKDGKWMIEQEKEGWKLYNLEDDSQKTKDVSQANPQVVKRLQGLIAKRDKSLEFE